MTQQQLFRRLLCRSQSLPTLTQGSTLSIRSNIESPNVNVLIHSEWKDSGNVSLYQHEPHYNKNTSEQFSMIVTQEKDKITSLLGRAEPHVSIHLFDEENEHITSSQRSVQLDVTVPEKVNIDCNLGHGGSILIKNKIEGDVQLKTADGTVHVDKLRGHNISIETENRSTMPTTMAGGGSKATTTPPKAANTAPSIYVSGSLEASILRLKTTTTTTATTKPLSEGSGSSSNRIDGGRIRVKRIHAKTVNVDIHRQSKKISDDDNHSNVSIINQNSNNDINNGTDQASGHDTRDDGDDSGSLCDISSLYVSGLATIQVESDTPPQMNASAVRIKSNHGTVVIDTSIPNPAAISPVPPSPLVDLGGVNGSCEVFMKKNSDDQTNNEYAETLNDGDNENLDGDGDYNNAQDWTSCKVHFDSIAPDSVSLIQAGQGNVSVTADRKVESDMRLLSASNVDSLDMEMLAADDEEGDGDQGNDNDKSINDSPLYRALNELDASSTRDGSQRIHIQSKSFTKRPIAVAGEDRWKNLDYVDGWIENKSGEPDSRFDRKIRGLNSVGVRGGGKIRIEGAAAQALQGFSQQSLKERIGSKSTISATETAVSVSRPLVAVASSGSIVLETLSWLGNIARRFGLEEHRGRSDLGRTATRRGRELVRPVDNE